ncbi:MAG: DNA replication protein [Kiloniellaceae bacterium]
MTRLAQLPLDLGHRVALGREDFLVAPGNAVAVAWIDRWPDWPGCALALHGPPGCGKTHLCRVWRALSGAVEVDGAALAAAEPRRALGEARACVVDGIQGRLAADPALQRRLLHLYNIVAERGGHLLMTGRNPPARWSCALADLRSRLSAVTAVGLAAPDDALIEALLVKLFADRQLRVGGDVIRYLLARMERSFDAARRIVAAVDRASLAERREITVPLARAVLEGFQSTDPKTEDEGGDPWILD